MHFQDLVAMIGISAAAGVALYMKFFRKYKFTTEGLDPANTGAKMFVVDYISDLLQRKFGVTEETVNYSIPFDRPEELTAEYKLKILLHIYKKKFDMNAIKELILRNNLDRPLGEGSETYYEISCADIDLVFRRHLKVYQALTFSDKVAILSQKIYEKYKGLGVIDDIRFMNIDGLNGGTSGVPQTFYQYGADTTYGAKPGELPLIACNGIWMMFKGKKIHLSCIGFETESELQRVTKNICRYNNAPTLSKMKGYLVNTTEDCRLYEYRFNWPAGYRQNNMSYVINWLHSSSFVNSFAGNGFRVVFT